MLFELINIEVQCSKNEFKNSWLSLRIIIVVHFSLFLRESLKILFKIYFLRSLHRKYSLLKFENCCLFAYTVSIIYIYSQLYFRANFTILQGFQKKSTTDGSPENVFISYAKSLSPQSLKGNELFFEQILRRE